MTNEINETQCWNILGNLFKTHGFVSHQIESFNNYININIPRIVREESDIVVSHDNTKYTVKFSDVYIPSPTIIEEDRNLRNIFPSEALRRDLTYDSPIYADITEILEETEKEPEIIKHNRVVIGRTPIMTLSNKCNLSGLSLSERVKTGECEWDHGGYFIIKGKERVLVGQIRGIYNQPMVLSQKPVEKYKYSCELRSMSEETGHSVLVQVKIGVDDRTIVLSIPYIKEYIPIGIVFKALGYTNEQIQDLIGLYCEKSSKYIRLIIRDSYFVESQDQALRLIGEHAIHTIKEDKRKEYAWQVVETELFPHLGISSTIKEKAYFLGYMVNKLISTNIGIRMEDDRDNYSNKRIEMAGTLCSDLFRTLFKRYTKTIEQQLEKKQRPDAMAIISRLSLITVGLRHCFATGNWGAQKNTYFRTGVSQVLSRLTYGATLSHLRRVVIPIGKEGKNAKIRQIHPSQIMYICPVETPEGQTVGIVLNLSLTTMITQAIPSVVIKQVLETSRYLITVKDFNENNFYTKVFLNGTMLGFSKDPEEFVSEIRLYRRLGILHYHISVTHDNLDNEIKIFSDEGRMIRPLLVVENNNLKIKNSDGIIWDDLVESNKIEYLDNSELQNCVIAMNKAELQTSNVYHYCEIAPAMMLGVMAANIPFSNYSQSPRNCYQSSMGKQAIGMFALSHKTRTDTIVHVLDYPQTRLVSTIPAKFMGFDDMPSGINAIVAIACYTGFNQEDSVIINKSSIDRGMFSITSYRTICEEETKMGTYNFESIGVPSFEIRKKDANYSLLDETGVVKLRTKTGSTYVSRGDVIVGKILKKSNKTGEDELVDSSIVIKTGEEGFVDRIFQTINPNGYRMVKIVIRNQKIPEVGDKFASANGQKGTCGMIYAQEDMPFTQSGITPDIIINPHCLVGTTYIETSDGETEYIKNIYSDENLSIKTINPETLEKSNTKYYNGFRKTPTGIKKITTTSGRKVKCTPEHMFLVVRSNNLVWVEAKDLIPYSDKFVISHSLIPVNSFNGRDFFIEKPVNMENEDNPFWEKMEELNLVGLIPLKKAKILARLLGFLESFGGVVIKNPDRKCFFLVEELKDYEDLCSDIEYLGFSKPTCESSPKLHRVITSGIFGKLMERIGATVGDKSRVDRIFPGWILNSCSSVKQEFLSGFNGGCGDVFNSYGDNKFRSRIMDSTKGTTTTFLKIVIKLLVEFNIGCNLEENIGENNLLELCVSVSSTPKNLSRFSDIVGFRYGNKKLSRSLMFIEYFKTRLNGINFEYSKFVDCFLYRNNIVSFVESVSDSSIEPVYDFTTVSENHSFVANGIVSHNCIPSRMTINQLMECVLGKSCVIEGTFGDATPFTDYNMNIADKLCDRLSKTGFERHGFEQLFNGMTGEPLDSKIFIGPTYYQRLKHMVSDKMHARSHGQVTTLTRQPLEGRSRDGGLRFGEMERDSMVSHGTSRFLKERLFDCSDHYQIKICSICGNFATNSKECKNCETDEVFTCNLPYSSKLLLQELQAMGIKTSIKIKK